MADVEMKSADEDAAAPAFEGISSRNRSTESWPWVEKYRPSSLDDLIAHQEIILTLNRLIDAQKLPHLLFYGPPGTGKTSMIIAAARRLYGKNYGSMVLELNASDDRGIDVVRNQIKEFAGTKKLFSQGVKLIILDEADSMTNDAQFSLRRVIEKYTKNARFCLICNYVSKIIPALQSRCTRFRFAPLDESQVSGRVKHIAQLEKLNMTEDGFKAILRLGQGDMRRILNILQATSMAHDVVDEANVYLCTGNPLPKDIESVTQWLFNENFPTAVRKCAEMQKLKGYATSDILQDVYRFTTELELPPRCRMYLYDELAKLEHRLSNGTTEELQLSSLVAVFAIAREQMSGALASSAGA
ncbi:Replication factor C subunit 5 [Phytophthora fragariae]|uniref:Replication factor C subunit 5 n=1 Tax=Phytophthora fragariae TaxID=53985 RepID=A0A6A3EUY0_9STRA|nr:Replication factor C subunit 5 [Phytophthora fragariae]KAE8937302.1 Replication factor C subunit 5 [Phytophthora fragariae]KAE9011548.1 Replication factor C subunit 5 [Phytophthora fragariae]KAE9092449.1 Replication factor C subunit 5 [Phytophthora fragariae]KAE9113985.1 Replication factor C subunit 5 [Phytophthora fragariae]